MVIFQKVEEIADGGSILIFIFRDREQLNQMYLSMSKKQETQWLSESDLLTLEESGQL